MKKLLSAVLLSAVLTGCGGGLTKPLSEGSTPDKKKVILIGKIEVSPAMTKKGYAADDKDKKFLEANISTRPFDDSMRHPDKYDFDEKTDKGFGPIQTNKFFVVEINPYDKAIVDFFSFTVSRPGFFGPDYLYSSDIHAAHWVVDEKMEAGKAYYIGTVKMDLHDKSYKPTGDQEYDKHELKYVVPSNVAIKDEYKKAEAWVKKAYPKIKDVKKSKTYIKGSGKQNKYNQVTVTTTYR